MVDQPVVVSGCKVLIASRKVERLNETAAQMRAVLDGRGPAELHTMQCNIREEDQVATTCVPPGAERGVGCGGRYGRQRSTAQNKENECVGRVADLRSDQLHYFDTKESFNAVATSFCADHNKSRTAGRRFCNWSLTFVFSSAGQGPGVDSDTEVREAGHSGEQRWRAVPVPS